MAIAPLFFESRGQDITPTMIEKLTDFDVRGGAAVLFITMIDEVERVAVGKHWFNNVCGLDRLDPASSWHRLITQYI